MISTKHHLMQICRSLFIVQLLLWGSSDLTAQNKESLFNLLTKNDIAKITLETDLTTMMENRKTNNYFAGTIISEDGTVRKVEIKTRGKYRRKTCEIPPLKLKFSKKSLVKEGLDTLNEIKLVTPCFDSDKGDELIIREYLAYKMFEKISPVSVRARLAKITFVDTHVSNSKKTFYGLLVEDEEELSARLGAHIYEAYGIEPDSLMSRQAALLVMFNYMIGNTDWEISMMRNVRFLRPNEGSKVLAVPYDFDFSGLVSAPYATPSSETGLKTVKDRFLMSSGLSPDALKRAAKTIVASKKELLRICNNKLLSRTAQEEVINYLEVFFNQLESTDELPSIFIMPPPED